MEMSSLKMASSFSYLDDINSLNWPLWFISFCVALAILYGIVYIVIKRNEITDSFFKFLVGEENKLP